MPPSKRPASPGLLPNPFIKRKNLSWSLDVPDSPLPRSAKKPEVALMLPKEPPAHDEHPGVPVAASDAADIEAGKAHIEDHLAYFTSLLSKTTLAPYPSQVPRLAISDYSSLYTSSLSHSTGAHFVIHQHDHPVAGTHYDLRLQINPTSSASWAIMYGLPGDPNSRRLNRNATETRVHCLWNHLVETASNETGSLLIWDTGTYEVLERRSKFDPKIDPASEEEKEDGDDRGKDWVKPNTEQEKLHIAFRRRKILLKLNGRKLPRPYVINLRLTKQEDGAGRIKASRSAAGPRRRRRAPKRNGKASSKGAGAPVETSSSSDYRDSDSDSEADAPELCHEAAGAGKADDSAAKKDTKAVSAMERELRELEDEEVRRTNAYTGATNTIGSIHQRRWYLSMHRMSCGFAKRCKNGRTSWEPAGEPNSQEQENFDDVGNDAARFTYPFYVRGPAEERSVVTGRQAKDIMRDEGVQGFVTRAFWKPVVN
jgi:hypothetical protein